VPQPTHEQDVERVVNFVKRLRRIALHPLCIEDDGELLHELMSVKVTFQVKPDGLSSVQYHLVDEVMFESLAVRLRPLTLNDDDVSYYSALKSLDRIIKCPMDKSRRMTSKQFRAEWRECTDEKNCRAYYTQTEDGIFTDVKLAFAWLYQDSVHGNLSTSGHLGVGQRFSAAVGVFSHLAVLALEMLNYINYLTGDGLLDLPVGTFSDQVIVVPSDLEEQGQIFASEKGADISEWSDMSKIPEGYQPLYEVLKAEEEKPEDPLD
jgi:hypothetical protein